MKNVILVIASCMLMSCTEIHAGRVDADIGIMRYHAPDQANTVELSMPSASVTYIVNSHDFNLATLPLEIVIDNPAAGHVVPLSIGTPDTKRHCRWLAFVRKLC